MSYLSANVAREAKRMIVLRDSYEKQLAELPKGSLRIKERNSKKYFYLTYRKSGKVVSQYVGNNENTLSDLTEQLERRKGIENLLRAIKKELSLMNKVLEIIK